MPMFNPNEFAGDASGGSGSKLTEATQGVLIAESMERNEGAKAVYFNVCFRVITGDHAGSYFYDNLSLSERAMWRLGKVALAMGQTEGVDLDDDDAVGDYFLDREFFGVTDVERDEQWGDRTRLNVQRLRALNKDDKKAVKEAYKERGTAHNEGWRGKPNGGGVTETDVPF
jgi:hypothetical protein